MGSKSSSSVPPPPTASLMNPTANSVMSPPPSLAPSGLESVSGKSAKSDSCHNQLCKQGAAGSVGLGAGGEGGWLCGAGGCGLGRMFDGVGRNEIDRKSPVHVYPQDQLGQTEKSRDLAEARSRP
ncbi:hypothetical protein OIU74_014363 [Salix koriyanagi]|uniref:Uncharacterized protein n=1 Tax=Salix koriyanagi TaxID=2511006 RepID=A0A9Q0PVH2_9ROSI|nr:hypothetical protein OIU74_014363 [Salix koriyanagi]